MRATPHSAPMPTGQIVPNQFDLAADLLGLESYMRRLLQAPFCSVTVEMAPPRPRARQAA